MGLAACLEEGPPVTQAEPTLDTLVVAIPTDATHLLSPLATSSFEASVLDLIGARPLDADFSCELKFEAELAKSWQWSTDGLELDLLLRSDFRWEDGTPVTASDLALAAALANDPEVASPRADAHSRLDPKARPEVVHAHHVRYRFLERGNQASMVASVALLQVVPNHLLGLQGMNRSVLRSHPLNTTAPLSSGRWKVASWEKGRSLVLEPNPEYPGPAPGLRKVVFNVVPDYAARLAAIEGGTADLMEGVQVADADALLTKAPGMRLVRRGYRAVDYIGWNQVEPPDEAKTAGPVPHRLFGDLRVRSALTAAIDVDRLIAESLTSAATGEVYAKRSVGTITPELCALQSVVQPIPFGTGEAKRGLAEAGWSDSNGDGVVDREGVDFRFSLLMPAGSPRREVAAGLILAQLREVGVDARLEVIDPAALVQRLLAHDFDAVYTGWSSGLQADSQRAWAAGSDLNFTSFADPEAERLLQAATAEPDTAKANELWSAFEARVYSQQPYTFLFWVDEIVAVHGRFEGAGTDLISPWHDLAAWKVPADRVRYLE